MSTGIGVGVLALAPLIGIYLIPYFGWRVSYLALAIFMWTMIPLALFVVRTKPADMGLYPDGVQEPMDMVAAQVPYSESKGLSLKTALSNSTLWLIAVAFLITGFCSVGVFQNQVPHLQDIGYPLETAVFAATGVGIGSTIGKFIFGWLCDKIQAKYVCAISLLIQAVSIIILISIKPASPVAIIWLYSIIMGLGGGGWLPTMSMLVSTNFGLISYGAIFGMINLTHSVGSAIGPLWAGYMYDTMNTYQWAFTITLFLYAIAITSILAAHRPKLLK